MKYGKRRERIRKNSIPIKKFERDLRIILIYTSSGAFYFPGPEGPENSPFLF